MKYCIVNSIARIGTFSEKADAQAALKYVEAGIIKEMNLKEESFVKIRTDERTGCWI